MRSDLNTDQKKTDSFVEAALKHCLQSHKQNKPSFCSIGTHCKEELKIQMITSWWFWIKIFSGAGVWKCKMGLIFFHSLWFFIYFYIVVMTSSTDQHSDDSFCPHSSLCPFFLQTCASISASLPPSASSLLHTGPFAVLHPPHQRWDLA